MNMKKLIGFSVLVLLNCSLMASRYPKREMRAVWIATIANIDWPSSAALSPEKQQKEAR